MGSYIPSTGEQRRQMLQAVGVNSVEELYADVPAEIRFHPLDLPKGKAELEVSAAMRGIAAKSHVFGSIFRGAGAYDHYIPAIVRRVVAKEEFVTAYTPYQAEISQGILQSIFEYQTMVCELTGLQAANASVYDGATAAAEAVAMCRERGRNRVLLSAGVHPAVRSTVQTYCDGAGVPVVEVPLQDGKTDAAALKALVGDTDACLVLQQPNYYGNIEDAAALGEVVHAAGAKFVMSVNPIAAGLLCSAAECGADIAVGEGQPLGMPLSFGGPYLGFMACTAALTRRLPGRIVGETVDSRGGRCYVLTLQAREQHIRREKASSNICSNQALCAMTATAYLAAVGQGGLKQAAQLSAAKAHYLAQRLCELPGFSLRYPGPFFHEFVTTCPVPPQQLMDALEEADILGGLPTEQGILWCATEKNTKQQIDRLVEVVRKVAR